MSHKNNLIGTAILFFFIAPQILSQQKLSITVDEAIQLGLKNSKSLHSSSMKVKASSARVSEVTSSRLPSIRFTGVYTRLSKIDPFTIMMPTGPFELSPSILNNYQLKLSLAQPLFTGFRLKSSSEMAEYQLKASEVEFTKDELETAFAVRNAYWSLFKAQEMKKVVDEIVNQMKAHLKDASNLLTQGMLTNNDVLKLQVQLSDVQLKQLEAANGVQLAQVNLNNTLGIQLVSEVEVKSAPQVQMKSEDELPTLLNKAFDKRGELKAADYRAKASESGVTIAKSRWYPEVSLYGNYYYNRPNQRVFPSKDAFKDTWDAGIMVSMDVWNWFATSHQSDQAEAGLAQSLDALGMIKDGISLEVTQNFLNYQQATQKINITKLTVEQADENQRITSEKFKNGVALSSDLIDAEVALLSAKTNYTSALVDLELAKAKLDKSIGE
ncbi:MAG: TolC family protein [Ignavibacteriaceae bacterium]|jgi:outer membrane protein TolC|nr:TolC family protein [Ignavibacteriaceae bacterium]